jgi:hypothetical protein
VNEAPDHEPQHFLGMPIEPGQVFPLVDPTEQRVLGVPLSWYRRETLDGSGLRHPIQWTKWRIMFHRLGPSAPDFKEYLGGAR